MYLLAVHGSPRKKGNTEILLDTFLNEAKHYFTVEKIRLSELNYQPCLECGECEKCGCCILNDDFQLLYEKILKADFLVIATPVFFYNHTSYVQAFFERFQVFWVRKYILKLPHPFNKQPKGILFSLGATKGANIFKATIRSFKYVLDTIYGTYAGGLFFRNIEKKGEIAKYPQFLEKARNLSIQIATLPQENWNLEK